MFLGISTIENKQLSYEIPSPSEKNNGSNTYTLYSRHSSLGRHNKDFVFSNFMLWRYKREGETGCNHTHKYYQESDANTSGTNSEGEAPQIVLWQGEKKSQTNQKSDGHHLVMGNRDQHVLVQGDRSSIFLVVPIRWPTLTGELETSRQQNANTWDDWLPVKLNKNWSQGLTALCGWWAISTEPTEEGSE